jgi:hypothetical protein
MRWMRMRLVRMDLEVGEVLRTGGAWGERVLDQDPPTDFDKDDGDDDDDEEEEAEEGA